MDNRLFLAIDAGTTVIKAALSRIDGSFVDTASCKLEIIMPHERWCEMDMESVWTSTCEVINELYERNKDIWPNIQAMGVCGQGDGMWPVGHDMKPVRNAVLWNDTRSGDLIDYDTINKLAVEHGVTPFFSGAGPVILRWLKDNEPESFNRVHKALHCCDWINYNLTGEVFTDHTNASTALMNIYTKEYDYEFLEILGIPQCKECFPQAVSSSHIIGRVTASAEACSRIPAGTPVIAGAIDVLAVATGCGMINPGQRGSIIGTTLCNYVVLDEPGAKRHTGEIGSVLCHTRPNTYIRLMAGLSGASTLDWVQKEVMNNEPYRQLEEKLAKIPTGSEGILYHPYIYGERAPFRNAGASGAFFGIRAHHTKYHMARASFEGMVLSVYDCYQSLPPGSSSIIVAGGAAKNNLICQMMCDCMGETVLRNIHKELGILGIIRLLQSTLGYEPKPEEIRSDAFTPDAETHELYKALYRKYRALQKTMEPLWDGTL